jgi:hypothetical protein
MTSGWIESVLEEHRVSDLAPEEGFFTNFLGLKTRADLLPHIEGLSGRLRPQIPIPDDGAYGGAAEYAGAMTAVSHKRDLDKSSFSAVELGAAFGPWISAAGLAAKRSGFAQINLVGVEADKAKAATMRQHLIDNDLRGANVSTKVIEGAAWSHDTTLYFPRALPIADYGGGVRTDASSSDYRGLAYESDPVAAHSLASICSDLTGVIDYMHWDIQGAEREVAHGSTDFLAERVRFLFIGTHSRAIEGDLMELFFQMGWDLLWQQPCAFTYNRATPTLEGMTTTDGEMFWRNPAL